MRFVETPGGLRQTNTSGAVRVCGECTRGYRLVVGYTAKEAKYILTEKRRICFVLHKHDLRVWYKAAVQRQQHHEGLGSIVGLTGLSRNNVLRKQNVRFVFWFSEVLTPGGKTGSASARMHTLTRRQRQTK